MEMKVSVKDRKTAVVTKLVKGDIVDEGDNFYEVVAKPVAGELVCTVRMRKVDNTRKTNARLYDYPSETRVKLVK
jgi:hypothetical protein